MGRAFAGLAAAIAVAMIAGLARAETLSWEEDYAKALDAAKKSAAPIVVIFDKASGSETVKEVSARLDLDESFRLAARKCVMARIQGYKVSETKGLEWYAKEAAAPAGAIVGPDGKPLKIYAKLPDAAAMAKDMLQNAVDVLLSEADNAVGAGNDGRAVALYWQTIAMKPADDVTERARRSLAQASRRGKTKVLGAEPMMEAKDYLKAKRYLEAISTDYAGTDADKAASDRLAEMLKDPAIVAAITAQENEEAAGKLLDEARKSAAGDEPEAARAAYQKILDAYPATEAAKQATVELSKARKDAAAAVDPAEKKLVEDCTQWMSYADTLAKQERRTEAIKWYKKVVDTYPDISHVKRVWCKVASEW